MSKFCNFTLALFFLALSFEGIFAPRSRNMGGGKSGGRSSQPTQINYTFDVTARNVPDSSVGYNLYISCEYNFRQYCNKRNCRLSSMARMSTQDRYCPNDKFKINIAQAGNEDIFHFYKFECPSISSENPHNYEVECDLSAQTSLNSPGTCSCTSSYAGSSASSSH